PGRRLRLDRARRADRPSRRRRDPSRAALSGDAGARSRACLVRQRVALEHLRVRVDGGGPDRRRPPLLPLGVRPARRPSRDTPASVLASACRGLFPRRSAVTRAFAGGLRGAGCRLAPPGIAGAGCRRAAEPGHRAAPGRRRRRAQWVTAFVDGRSEARQPPPNAWMSCTAALMRRPWIWMAVISLLRAVVWTVITLR